MPTVVLADPILYDDPSLVIDGQEYACVMKSTSLVPNEVMADVATVCNPSGERPLVSHTTYTLDAQLLLSFGAAGAAGAGSWNTLNAIAGLRKTVVLKNKSSAVGADNPSATFDIYVPRIPFMAGQLGQAMPFQLTAKSIGTPVFAVT